VRGDNLFSLAELFPISWSQ